MTPTQSSVLTLTHVLRNRHGRYWAAGGYQGVDGILARALLMSRTEAQERASRMVCRHGAAYQPVWLCDAR